MKSNMFIDCLYNLFINIKSIFLKEGWVKQKQKVKI